MDSLLGVAKGHGAAVAHHARLRMLPAAALSLARESKHGKPVQSWAPIRRVHKVAGWPFTAGACIKLPASRSRHLLAWRAADLLQPSLSHLLECVLTCKHSSLACIGPRWQHKRMLIRV